MNAYERYEKKIRDLARLLALLKKNSPFIAAALVLLAAAVVTLLMITGNITEEVVCNDITYGDVLSYRAGVLWTDVRFEFSALGSEERFSEEPSMPGDYVIYAYGENVFGQRKYSTKQFTIKKRMLTVKLSGTTVTYGDEINADDIVRIDGLLSKDKISPLTLVYDRCLSGNSMITVDANALTVTDPNGKDVTAGYDINVIHAYVTINKRKLVISTPSFLKVYDASPLESDGEWKLEAGSLVDGDKAEFRVGGSLTEVGEIPNSVIYTHITNAEGRNVSDCYEIEAREGIIKVVKGHVVLRVNDLTTTYTGNSITPEIVSVDSGKLYDGDHLGSVVYSGSGTEVGDYLLGLRSFAIMNNGRDVTDDYIVDVIPGTLSIVPIKLTVKTNTQSFIYDGMEHTGTYQFVKGTLAENHKDDVASMASIHKAGSIENKIEILIRDENGTDVTKNYSITYDYGQLTVTKRPIKLRFNDSYTKYNGKTPVIGHYNIISGSLAVDNYVNVAPKNEMIDVGTYYNELIINIICRGEDVTDCYDINAQFGTLLIQKANVTFVTNSGRYVYNGEEYTHHSYSAFPFTTARGHSYTNVNFISSLKIPGTIPNEVEKNVRIVNEAGRDVTHNFNIYYEFGTLTVLHRPITLTTNGLQKMYDGTPLVYQDDFKYNKQAFDEDGKEKMGNGLILGHRIVGDLKNTSITDFGSIRMYVTNIKIYDENDQDVTLYYNIGTDMGVLQITKRSLVITTGTSIKLYDGTPLTNDEYTVTGDGLANGERLDFAVVGTITEPGTVPNRTTTIKILKPNGTDSTNNYSVYTSPGTLTVVDPNAPTTDIGGGGSDNPSGTGTDPDVSGTGTGTGGSHGNGDGTNQNDPPKNEPGFSLDPNGNLGIPDSMPGTAGGQLAGKSAFSVYSTESHVAYLKYMSFGDYNGKKWGKAPVYASLLDGKYSFEYLTGIALSKSNMRRINMKLKLKVSDYLLPYYLGTDQSDYTIQKDDSVHYGNGNEEYSVYYYYYDISTSGIPKVTLGEYTNSEIVYRRYVYDKYLTLPATTAAYCKSLLESGDFGSTTEEKIKNILEFVSSNAVYDLGYDRALDRSSDIAVSFLRDYGEGVCQHFATAATVLFRAAGIPARYTIGWVTRTEANEWVDQKGAAHAWVEVYIDGIGWMHVDPTPSSALNIEDLLGGLTDPDVSETLPDEPGNVTKPENDDVLRFRTGYTGPMYFRERNYSQFVNGSWTRAETDTVNEYEKLQLILAAQALETIGATEYSVQIDYLQEPDNLLLPYFITKAAANKEVNGDISYAFDGKMSGFYRFIPAIRSQSSFVGASLTGEYAEIEQMYAKLVKKVFLQISVVDRSLIRAYFPDLENHSSSTSKINYVLGIVREMRRKAELDGITEAASLNTCISGGYLTSDEYATTLAVLMLRMLGVPSRYVEGYLASSVSSTVTTVKKTDRTCWIEVYVDGIGWIPVSIREDIPNLFEEDDDVRTQLLEVTLDSAEKLYDGKPLSDNGFKITRGRLLNGHTAIAQTVSEQIYVGSSDNICQAFTVLDESGNDVSHLYKLNILHGRLTVYPLTANPIEYVKGMVGQKLSLSDYRWWNGEVVGKVGLGFADNENGTVLIEDGELMLFSAGIYRLYCIADGVDYNSDGIYELEPIERFEFSVVVNEFTNVFTVDMTLDEAVMRNHQTRPAVPTHFSPDGTHIGLVVEMNSKMKLYDGKELTADGASVINGRLRPGDTVEAKGSGSILFCGKTKNGCKELIIRDSEGNDVTSLYAVTVYPGILTVSTGSPTPPSDKLSIGLGETMYVGELFRSEYISNYPMSISLVYDGGCVSLDGDTLRGKGIGNATLKVTLYGCDLNGDGYNEYSQQDYIVRIKTSVAAWQIALAVIFVIALCGYITVCIFEKKSKKEKSSYTD